MVRDLLRRAAEYVSFVYLFFGLSRLTTHQLAELVHPPARFPQGLTPNQPSSQAAATHLEAMRLNPHTYPTLPLPLPVAPTHKEKVAGKKKLLRFGILHFGEMGLVLRMGS